MSALTRLWIVCVECTEMPDAQRDLIVSAQPVRVYCAPQCEGLAHAWRAALSNAESIESLATIDDATLRRLADRHPGSGVLLVLSSIESTALAQRALSTVEPPSALELTAARLLVVDWPPTVDVDGRPAFIGLDLDWLPPPPPLRRAKFPGGPGAAPAARG
ncbi:MAG: hypothetical protein IT454_14460 [Planctomycetes bacterium]|nr:hypothetical protein [Planctomycetota bacterium]